MNPHLDISWLSSLSIAAATYFNYMGLCRWFLGRFRWFWVVSFRFKGTLWSIFCININTHNDMTGNEKLCKISFKKLVFQNVLVSIDLFYRYHDIVISSTQIACDVMCVQDILKQPPELFFNKGVLKILLIWQENTCVGVSF